MSILQIFWFVWYKWLWSCQIPLKGNQGCICQCWIGNLTHGLNESKCEHHNNSLENWNSLSVLTSPWPLNKTLSSCQYTQKSTVVIGKQFVSTTAPLRLHAVLLQHLLFATSWCQTCTTDLRNIFFLDSCLVVKIEIKIEFYSLTVTRHFKTMSTHSKSDSLCWISVSGI